MKTKNKTEMKQFFGENRSVYSASAPGRLDVMGGIADYSGSLVLQMPIKERTDAFLAKREDRRVRIYSESAKRAGLSESAEYSLDRFVGKNGTIDYTKARAMISKDQESQWAAYALGCFLVLQCEKGVSIPGADIWIDSNVPIGKGVSSSAAIEVAVMTVLAHVCKLKLGKTELPILAQTVENQIAGAPCGLMDQLASYLGEKDRLLPILCQPDLVRPSLTIPNTISFVGIDSGVRHAVSGASYGDVRAAAFMGYTIIARSEGATMKSLQTAKRSGDTFGLPYAGYLANIPPSLFETKYRILLPEVMSGREFLKQYGTTIDSVTTIQQNQEYAIQNCAAHPVYENHRVNAFANLLSLFKPETMTPKERRDYLFTLGELMYQSHASYSNCGLGNAVTDEIVEAVRAAGPERGVYGAKITGGGSGGTVCVLCAGPKGVKTAKQITMDNAKKQGIEPVLFTGSGMGARLAKARRVDY